MLSRRIVRVHHKPRSLSFEAASISLRIFVGNAAEQVEMLREPSVTSEQLSTVIKALQLAMNASDATLPLLRAKRRELLRSANG